MTLFPPLEDTFEDVIKAALKASNITSKEASIKLGYVNPCQLDEHIRRGHGFRKQSAQNFIEKICVPAKYDIGYTTSGLTLLSHRDKVMFKACPAGKIIISNLLFLNIGTAELAKSLNKSERLIVSVINGNYTPQNFDKLKKQINEFFYRNSLEGDDFELPAPFPEAIEPSLIDDFNETKGVWISFEEFNRLEELVSQIRKRVNQ